MSSICTYSLHVSQSFASASYVSSGFSVRDVLKVVPSPFSNISVEATVRQWLQIYAAVLCRLFAELSWLGANILLTWLRERSCSSVCH